MSFITSLVMNTTVYITGINITSYYTFKQVVKLIWHKTASLLHMDRSTVFARRRQCAPHVINTQLTWFLRPTQVCPQMSSRLVQPFCRANQCVEHIDTQTTQHVTWIATGRIYAIWLITHINKRDDSKCRYTQLMVLDTVDYGAYE